MPRPNPFTQQLDFITQDMRDIADTIEAASEGVEPFDSVGLSDDEEAFAFENPAALFPDEVDEMTGLPLSNAQAAALLLQQMGPVRYVEWAEKHYQRMMGGNGA